MNKYIKLFILSLLLLSLLSFQTRANEVMIEPRIKYIVSEYSKDIPIANYSDIRIAGSSDCNRAYLTKTYKYFYARIDITQTVDNKPSTYYQFYFINMDDDTLISRIVEVFPSDTYLLIPLGCTDQDNNNIIYHFIDFAAVY